MTTETKILDLKAPRSWSELTQAQLKLLLKTISRVNKSNAAKTFDSVEDYAVQTATQVAIASLFAWNDIEIVSPFGNSWIIKHDGHQVKVNLIDLSAAADMLDWINLMPDEPVRLAEVNGAKAVDAALDDSFSFDDWLSCETLWLGYQQSHDDELLRQMGEFLYHKPGLKMKDFELLCIFYWWGGLKNLINRLYPNFMHPAESGSSAEITPEFLRQNMNSQIRALTKGDVTKEHDVLSLPAHRALTELDALAKEYDDLNRKYGNV